MSEAMAPERLIPWPEAKELFGGISRVTVWRAVKAGKLPAPQRTSPGRVAWSASSIRDWQERNSPQAAHAA
jgi:predicted DNA-binding transcriptional regulator AlpA